MRRTSANKDPREQPAYGLAEAARYMKVPAPTLRAWVGGRIYPKAAGVGWFKPLIHPAQKQPAILSFWNLIEAHVLRSLRTEHAVSLRDVREALAYAERAENIERLLLSKELRTHAGDLFLDKYGQLIHLKPSGQFAMRKVFEEHLKRVEWDEWKFPIRLYPFVASESPSIRTIAIDPNIAFGRPVIARTGISTSAIAGRIDAQESVAEVADDYDLTTAEVEQAILYERAA